VIVVVSNRVARMEADEPIAGGLASALLPVVRNSGAVWVGSSGRVREGSDKDSFAEIEALGTGALATVDLPAAHYQGFYEGFANSALWPALHSRADLVKVTVENYASYREVNAFMARALLRFDRGDATFWVQDYHFLTLGLELRRLGVDRPIGFFLHTPWPARAIMHSVPHHRDLVQAMLAYDLIGFQTDEDRQNFKDYVRHQLGFAVAGDIIVSEDSRSRLATFPIGINVDDFAARAAKAAARPEVARLRASLQNTKLLLGVDRLDYSKGIANRIRAFDRLLLVDPSLKRQVSLLQIAVPSRGQIEAYRPRGPGPVRVRRCRQGARCGVAGQSARHRRHGAEDFRGARYAGRGAQGALARHGRQIAVGLRAGLVLGFPVGARRGATARIAGDGPQCADTALPPHRARLGARRPPLASGGQPHNAIPPSTRCGWPVTKDDSSEARNTASAATSAAVPSRPIG